MLKSLKRSLIVGGAAAAVVAMGVATAQAATWTVIAGTTASGSTTHTSTATGNATNPAISFVDVTHPLTMTCQSSQAKGAVPHLGSGLNNPLATITSSTWTTCKGPLGVPLTVSQNGTWNLNGVSYTSPVTLGNVSNVNASVSGGTGCTFTVTGTADGSYSNLSHALTMAPRSGSGSVLTMHTVPAGSATTCFGLIHDNDVATFSTFPGSGSAAAEPYVVTTPLGNLTITSP